MRSLLLSISFVLCVTTHSAAREHQFTKRISPSLLKKELISNGFKVKVIDCIATACTLVLDDDETRNPKPIIDAHVFIDLRAKDRQELAAIKALTAKWRAGTITPAEKDDLILRFIERSVSSF